ncbi:5-oxoprolinase subunit B family protein [Nocardioides yefusunii]|uniref:Allophanate hydrolase subunit 1 n=1 Tax=Nocardioides yefusunii TaxID=2500546 RepID=A0ABW1QWB0_9ACTN|nr:allophanate hydrolase subunit 1 [Nocardioides yefusunii]
MSTGPLSALVAHAVRTVGEHAVLVEVADTATAHAVVAWVRESGMACVDVVPAARTVLLDGVADTAAAMIRLRSLQPHDLPPAPAGEHDVVVLPVHYDGADLALVARTWGVDVDEVVTRHTSLTFVSDFCGFSPGFAYLSGMPSEWRVPRLSSPRTRVPAGSVALADTWCGVYPTPSPGGWLLLGHTDVEIFDVTRTDAPALLAPGTRVRFTAA